MKEKVVIPKIVAEWIETCKSGGYGIEDCLSGCAADGMPDEVVNWFSNDEETIKEKDLLVARAYLDGYVVEGETPNAKEKVTIPKIVAEWIETCKSEKYGIAECLSNATEFEMPDAVVNWFEGNHEDVLEKELLVARAYLDGYEVEEEKRY